MAWTSPRTWTAGEILTDAHLNAHVRDNLNALKSPSATDINDITATGNYSTNSTTFVDVDTAFEVTVTPDAGGAATWVMIWARFSARASGSATVRTVTFDIVKNGVSVSGGNGLAIARGDVDSIIPVTILHWEQISAATTFKLQWKVENSGDNATIFVQNGGVNHCRPQFGAREVS